MTDGDDHQLLADFAQENSEAAFATLVQRHVGLVYSVALRSVSNTHAAEEITQAVFIILAQKAGKLSARVVLSGWLYQTTRLTAANFLRGEIRRHQREQEAYMQSTLNEPTAEAWPQIAPLLDDALGKLGEADRNALVLRFFENKNLRDVGTALGASEDAAKMRVNRALEKLRKIFGKRGVSLTTAIIAGAVSANAAQAAPVGLAKTISAVALTKGATAGGSTLALAKGALKIMAWTKMKMAVVVSVGLLLAAGTTTLAVKRIQKHETYPWQVPQANFEAFYAASPQVEIVPTKFANGGYSCCDGGRGAMGICITLESIIETAYQKDNLRTVVTTDLPPEKFDFIAKLVPPRESHKNLLADTNWTVELQKQIAKQFHIGGRLEMRDADVLVLKPVSSGIRGFKPSHKMPNGQAMASIAQAEGNGLRMGYSYHEQPVSTMQNLLEQHLKIPIIDKTGLAENYDYSLSWIEQNPKGKVKLRLPDLETLSKNLLDQLGLELVSTNLPIEMLVVEKVK